ncbi:MAG: PAS domain S-box protein [Pirellulales bacterium]
MKHRSTLPVLLLVLVVLAAGVVAVGGLLYRSQRESCKVEGVDYRGVPVPADVDAVSDSPWFLVAKIDSADVYTPMRERLWRTVLFMGILLLVLATIVGFLWRRRHLGLYRQKFEAEDKYRAILEASADGILMADVETKSLKYPNPALCRMLGYTERELRSMTVADIHPKDALQNVLADFESQARGDNPLAMNVPCLRKDGAIIHVDINTTRATVDGRTCLVGVFRDTSERKRAQTARERLSVCRQSVNLLQQSLLEPAPLEDKLRKVTDGIVRIFDADFCRIWLTRPGDLCQGKCIHAKVEDGPHACRHRDRCLHLVASSGRYTHTDGKAHRRIPIGCYEIGRIASAEDPKLLTNDVPNDPRVHNHPWACKLGLLSFAGYQIRAPGGDVLGVLALFAKHPIDESEDTMLDGLSVTVALVVQQAAAEEAMRESEKRFMDVLYASSDAILLIDGETFVDCNEATARMLGYSSRDEFLMTHPSELSPPTQPDGRSSFEKANEMMRTAFERGFHRFEWMHRRANGEDFSVEVSLTPVVMRGKSLLHCVWRDITDRKRTEETLRESEERFRTIFEEAPMGVALIDSLTGRICEVNPRFADIAGRTREEMATIDWMSITHPDDVQEDLDNMALLNAGKIPGFSMNKRYRRPDGSYVWIHMTIAPMSVKDKSHPRHLCMIEDITDRKRAEEALRKNEAMLSCILNSLPLSIFWKDHESVYLGCNAEFARGANLRPEDVVGKTDLDLPWSREDTEAYRADDREVITSGRAKSHLIERQHRADGTYIWLDTTKIPLLDAEGRVYGVVGIYDDITERKRMEDEVHTAKDAANAANRAKSEFLGNMSHEIRTPLTAILGYTDMLYEEVMCCPVCPDHTRCQRRLSGCEAVGTVKRNAEHLLQVVNDILDLSKVEAGKMEIEPTRCSPVQLVAEVVSLMRVRAEAKQLKLEMELVHPLPETVFTDPLRLRQVLVNLVGNAIKFTDQGEVRIIARLVSEDGPPRLRFDVTDTGIGMNEEQIGKLFQPFTQVDSSATRKFGGTGLGLAISKRLAEVLGGAIEVRSTPGKGSTFRVTIDPGPLEGIRMIQNAQEALLERPPTTTTATPDKIELHGRILLVEDGLDNQRLIRFLLEKAGAEVAVVENGQLAVEAALAAREVGEPFDMILMDMQMPVMDGYEATRALRGRGYTGPIVALTAHSMVADRQKCLDAGCDDYATKPVDRQKLLATVAHWTARGRTNDESRDLQTDPTPRGDRK